VDVLNVILEFLLSGGFSSDMDIERGPVEVDGSLVVLAGLRVAGRSSARWRIGDLRLGDPLIFSWRRAKRRITLPSPQVGESRTPQIGEPWGNCPGSRIFVVTSQDHRYEIVVNRRSVDVVRSCGRTA
jgi:hypothetical protein